MFDISISLSRPIILTMSEMIFLTWMDWIYQMRSDIDCNKYVCGIWINSYERSAQHPHMPVFLCQLSHCFPWQGTRKVCVSNINGNALIDLQPSHPLFTTNSLEPSSTPFIYLIFATYYRSQIFYNQSIADCWLLVIQYSISIDTINFTIPCTADVLQRSIHC